MNQILISINVCGLLALIAICYLFWTAPPPPKMLRIPVSSIILERRVEITAQGGLEIFTGITGWNWEQDKPMGGPLVIPPINNLRWHGKELRTLLIF